MAARIDYDTKEQGQVSTRPVEQQWRAEDANDVRDTVDSHADDIEALQGQTLDQITTNGNETTEDILFRLQTLAKFFDNNDELTGFVAGDDYYGLVVGGSTDDGLNFDTPISIKGSSTVLLSDTLGIAFNGAEAGNFLRIIDSVTLPNGDVVYPVASVALDVTEYSETFTDSNDYGISDSSFTTVVSGVVANQYRLNTSQANYSFLIENASSQTRVIEYSLTVNDAAPTDIFTVQVPRNTTIPVNGADTVSDAQIEIGDSVELKVKTVSGGSVNVLGTTQDSTIVMEQAASIQNGIQSVNTLSGGGTLSVRALNEITVAGVYTLPQISLFYTAGEELLISVTNISGVDQVINSFGTDDIYTPEGIVLGRNIKDGESITFYAINSTRWGIVSSSKEEPAVFFEFVDSANFSRPSQTTEGLISQNNTYQDYLVLEFTPEVDGFYQTMGFCEWSYDVTNADIEIQVELEDLDAVSTVALIVDQHQEPQDSGSGGVVLDVLSGGVISGTANSGTEQRYNTEFSRNFSLTGGTNYRLTMRWASQDNSAEATMYNGNMSVELKKQ